MSTQHDPALASLRIDGVRLWASLMRLAAIGATPKGGVCRLALTEQDRRGRHFFVAQARAIGCEVRVDTVGNLFARRAGRNNGALGQRWYDVVVTGMEAHAGPTPMAMRQDAMLAGAELVGMVNRIAMTLQPHGRATVGHMEVHPDSRNVIPGRVAMTVDLRSDTDAALSGMDRALREGAAQVATRTGVRIEIEQVVYFPPQPFDARMVASVRAAARRLGLSEMDVISGAGHDAVHLACVAPAAMIFVPCKDGISHNEIEDARPEHLEAGCNVLLQVMLEAANLP